MRTGPFVVATLLSLGTLWSDDARAGGLSIGINIGAPVVVAPVPLPPPVVLAAPPPLVVVPGSPVYYAPSMGVNFFVYGGRYYTYHGGHWFYARGGGPWVYAPVGAVPAPLLAVPVAYYKVPPGHGWRGGPPWAGGKHRP